ncbi:hypothetical protein C8J57DRAFT_1179663 [Mycena rebaudengoi]|nr:hypothetical protein C8J57DRAFT_1179663 [Mycena rebaudengoi]
MSDNVAIVDKRDVSLRYTGSWEDGGNPQEFNGTTRFSRVAGSKVSLTFIGAHWPIAFVPRHLYDSVLGTSITVYGTVAAWDPPLASWEFTIDGAKSGEYEPVGLTADIHHEAIWTSPTISSGSHTLKITQSTAQSLGVLFLDYLMYTTTTSSAVNTYFIDDRDPRITYTPSWRRFGSEPDFQHTSEGSTSAGDKFSFRKIHLILRRLMKASIVVDSDPPVIFIPDFQSEAVTTNNLIFKSKVLSEGSHTLVVTAENNNTVWIDYLLVVPHATNTVLPSSTSSLPSTSTTSSTSSTTASSSKSPSGGIIAGAVVGGLVLGAVLAAAIFLICRRRRRFQAAVATVDMSQHTGQFPPLPPVASTPIFAAGSIPANPSQGYSAPSALSHPSQSAGYLSSVEFDPWALSAGAGAPTVGAEALPAPMGVSPTPTAMPTPMGPLLTPEPPTPRRRTREKGCLSGPSRPASQGDIDAPPTYSA